jgi:hypothetical protein
MFGFWTQQYISALGQNSGGGGGGTDLNEPLSSINDAGLGATTAAGQVLTWNGTQWVYNIPGGGGSAEELTNKTVTASTLDGLAGSFTFQGDNLISSSVDYVGMQIGSSVDKFQIACQDGSLMIRQNDNGGTSTSGWTDWTMMLTASNYANYITGFVTLDTAQTISGTKTFTNTVHLNAITEPSADNGLLVYKPASGWSGISSTQWGVGSTDSQGVIRSSNTNLIHYKGGSSYTIWDSGNDGADSGLDADLLDGHHASDFALATWVSTNYLTKADANNTYLSIEFFRALFRAYTSGGSEVVPNGGSTSTIDNIKAMFGFWTQQYISALGQNSGGGGGGTDLNEPLSSINDAGLGAPTAAGQVLTWNGSQWVYNIPGGGGGGTGTVTSITAGTGLSGGTITTMGTIAISSAYQTYIQHGETAYGWGNHASAGYATPNSVATQMQNYAYISNGAIHIGNNSITPLTQHQTVDGTFWGQSWSNRGTVSGSINAGSNGGQITGFHSIELNNYGSLSGYGGFIDFHYNGSSSDYTSRIIEDANGRLFLDVSVGVRIGSALLSWDGDNNALKIQKIDGTSANFYATGGVSALGMSAGASSIDAMTFNYINVNNQLKFGTNDVTMYVDDMFYIESSYDISINGVEMFNNYVSAKRLYLDSTRYLFISSGKLYFYNGSINKEIAFIN